jgi:hypothetical protein
VTATRHLQKAIDDCARVAFRGQPEVYARYFPTVGTSIGTVKAVEGKGQHFERGEALLVMDNIWEQLSAQPGDGFGMKMAKNVTFNYVWLNFDTADPVSRGRVEVSNDGGTTWQTVALTVEGGLVYGRVDGEAGFNAVRWINASDRPVSFKITRFNVDLAK